MLRTGQTAAAILLSSTFTMAAVAGPIEAVEPFTGEASEGFEGFGLGQIGTFPILNGQATIGTVLITSFSSFMGSTVVPRSGSLMAHTTNPIDFVFAEPVHQFGVWVATNGGSDGGVVEFFDGEGALIGTAPLDVTFMPGTAPYTWNGWVSSTPIGRIHVSGNGVLNGFLGFDDVEVIADAPVAECPWDVNGDGDVGISDILQVIFAFGECEEITCPEDIDGDAAVGIQDLIAVIQNFGACPGVACIWDLDGDGFVDPGDLLEVLAHIGACDDPDDCPWDLNGDGFVGHPDVFAVIAHFGPCP